MVQPGTTPSGAGVSKPGPIPRSTSNPGGLLSGEHYTVAIVPERAISGQHVTRILDQLAATRGVPQVIRTDNGKAFCSRAMLTWAHAPTVTLSLIEPGKPNQNADIESFTGAYVVSA